jgi:hypothetical protein
MSDDVIEMLRAARIPWAFGMYADGERVMAIGDDGQAWTTGDPSSGYTMRKMPADAVPDLEDRATFLLACDEAERRGVSDDLLRSLRSWQAWAAFDRGPRALNAALARAFRDSAPTKRIARLTNPTIDQVLHQIHEHMHQTRLEGRPSRQLCEYRVLMSDAGFLRWRAQVRNHIPSTEGLPVPIVAGGVPDRVWSVCEPRLRYCDCGKGRARKDNSPMPSVACFQCVDGLDNRTSHV